MWIKYQQATSKMASFDPRELMKNKKEEVVVKFPLKRFEPTLRTSLQIAIPTNLQRLKKHRSNIERYMIGKQWKDLNMEQINASRTVQQLQATIRELENVRNQVKENDLREFEKRISPMKEEAINAIQEFVSMHKEMQAKLLDSATATNARDLSDDNAFTGDGSAKNNDLAFHVDNVNEDVQIQYHQRDREEFVACQSWDHLKDGLLELNTLVEEFSTVVHSQQETVDRIEDNIEVAQQNVNKATTHLGLASKYKAAVIPVAGAIVGGLIGGPIGLMAGFKIAGAAAAVGSGIGFAGGKYLEKKHNSKVEMELQNLSSNQNNS